MALSHTPLEQVSDAVGKVLAGPAAMKTMAAKGMSPLSPKDLVAAIYMLSLDADGPIAAAARETAGKMPDKLLAGVLAEPLDVRILDFFAQRLVQRKPLLEVVIVNKTTAVDTIAQIAKLTHDAAIIDLIAENETRLLAGPQIIAAMYLNPKARMSTVTRATELAARNNVKVDIPRWDDVVAEISRSGPEAKKVDVDAAFEKAASAGAVEDNELSQRIEKAADAMAELLPDEVPADLAEAVEGKDEKGEDTKQRIQDLPTGAKMRLAMLGNAFARSVLIRDSNRMVAVAAVNSPRIKDSEIVAFAGNRSLSDDVIREIANAKEWLRLYQVKVNLVFNPKCPLQVSMRLLPHLRDKQLKVIVKSKNIPSALSQQAKKLTEVKKPAGKP